MLNLYKANPTKKREIIQIYHPGGVIEIDVMLLATVLTNGVKSVEEKENVVTVTYDKEWFNR